MNLDLDNKTVLVTGGTSGIGLATVHQLAAEGAHPIAVARRTPADHILPAGADFIAADLADPNAIPQLVTAVTQRYGRIDGLVNAAALFDTRDTFAMIDDDLWRTTFEVNLFAIARLTRAVIPLMEHTGGSLVHLGSEAGRMPDPTMAAYAASKAALLSMSKSLAVELGPHHIRSNVVSPGPTRTALFDAPGGFADQLAQRYDTDPDTAIDRFIREERRLPTQTIGQPDHVAGLITYLLSPKASQVTGAEWTIDGGALRQI